MDARFWLFLIFDCPTGSILISRNIILLHNVKGLLWIITGSWDQWINFLSRNWSYLLNSHGVIAVKGLRIQTRLKRIFHFHGKTRETKSRKWEEVGEALSEEPHQTETIHWILIHIRLTYILQKWHPVTFKPPEGIEKQRERRAPNSIFCDRGKYGGLLCITLWNLASRAKQLTAWICEFKPRHAFCTCKKDPLS